MPPARRAAAGLSYALAAYLTWGLVPVYFRALAGVPPLEILAHRIAWSVPILWLLVQGLGRWAEVRRPLASPRSLLLVAATTALIGLNWLVYIWAVDQGRVLEASLGYFVNPLVNVLLGVLFLREPLTRRQVAAVALASAGVLALVLRAGRLPWISLVLALSFGTYGLLRKRARLDAVAGLLVETGLLAPLALVYLWRLHAAGTGHLGASPRLTVLLVASGLVTSFPLIWFAKGVERLRLSTVGLVQYVAPSMQFAIAVFLFREPFGAAHAVAFACIWTALALYAGEAIALARRVERPASR
ncbi:MAG TPA: EamA family transporter RarD [Anaeromyxobacteraceae bacterium]|jgi:chloramphenicol-sensitive protein RarD